MSKKEGVDVFKAAGARQAWGGPPGGQHIMGTDLDKSVLNGYAQSHDVDNLFVAGPSTFPTSSCVNSTFTAKAVALKTSDYMLENWGDFAGV